MNKTKIFLILSVFAVAVFFRFYNLDTIPPGLYPDVAVNGTDAQNAAETGNYKVYYPENNGREGLFINIIAVFFLLFGPSVWAIKAVAALFGVLTIFGFYFLIKETFRYFDKKNKGILSSDIIALLSTFFLSISFWHINFSRLGFRAIMAPFFLVWCFYFLLKAAQPLSEKKTRIITGYWLLAGLSFGLGFHSYIAFRVAPLIVMPLFIFSLIARKKNILKPLANWLVFGLGILIAASPLIYYYLQNPADFMGRAGQVSVFASPSPIKALLESTIKTLGQFMVWGDPNWRHNFSGSPQIFWPLIPFFLLGIGYFFSQILKKKNYKNSDYGLLTLSYTLLFWWAIMLLPSVMTNEGLPHALRSIGAIPPTYIFIGLGSFFFIKFIHKKIEPYQDHLFAYRAIAWGLVVFCLLALGAIEYSRYFIAWGNHPETHNAFGKNLYDMGAYLKSLPPNAKKYVILNEGENPECHKGIAISSHTIKFLAPADTQFIWPGCPEFKELLNSTIKSPTVFIPLRRDKEFFHNLGQKIPGGYIWEQFSFAAYKINF